jgi:hypothetical protein
MCSVCTLVILIGIISGTITILGALITAWRYAERLLPAVATSSQQVGELLKSLFVVGVVVALLLAPIIINAAAIWPAFRQPDSTNPPSDIP